MTVSDGSAAACPVDHQARQAWLDAAQAQSTPHSPPTAPTSAPTATALPSTPASSSLFSRLFSFASFSTDTNSKLEQPTQQARHLDTFREISSIPRAEPGQPVSPPVCPSEHGRPAAVSSTHTLAVPANGEQDADTSESGHWVYPSEQQFFDAMRRKKHNPRLEDMRTIVPIHNAVNERAWKEILEWEKGSGGERCGGPKLVAFSGSASNLSPRARINGLLGYQPPFDRHDWIVDRCGDHIEYVIDFYVGKDEHKDGRPLNFYLDVRPKLNSWQGWQMRFCRFWGL